MKEWVLEKWDWFIYWRFYRSLNRICIRKPGMAYLMELIIHEWVEDQNLPENLRRATEEFHRQFPKGTP